MDDAIGPRDGRQASGSRKDTVSANVLNLEVKERKLSFTDHR